MTTHREEIFKKTLSAINDLDKLLDSFYNEKKYISMIRASLFKSVNYYMKWNVVVGKGEIIVSEKTYNLVKNRFRNRFNRLDFEGKNELWDLAINFIFSYDIYVGHEYIYSKFPGYNRRFKRGTKEDKLGEQIFEMLGEQMENEFLTDERVLKLINLKQDNYETSKQ